MSPDGPPAPAHLHAALYQGAQNARAIEVKIADDAGANPAVRLTFGTSLEDNCVILHNSGMGGMDLWTVAAGTLSTHMPRLLQPGAPITQGNTVRLSRNGQVFKAYVNGRFAGFGDPKMQILPASGVMAGVAGRDADSNVAYDWVRVYEQTSSTYMHLSFDDVSFATADLENYASVWDQPLFAFLKSLRATYGAVFSLYLYYTDGSAWNLAAVTTAHRAEFQAASDWLRFGFHAHGAGSDYSVEPTANALGHYDATIAAIRAFAGDECVDRMPRSHYFAGTLATVRAWRDTTFGIRGLLSADDDRLPYYLTAGQRDCLLACDDLYDEVEHLYLVRTDLRLENEVAPASMLDARLGDYTNYGGQQDLICVFTHEQLVDETMKAKLDGVCAWAVANGYGFAFPMDHVHAT